MSRRTRGLLLLGLAPGFLSISCSKPATYPSGISPMSGPTYPLTFQTGLKTNRSYTLHREWKADPHGSGNGNYIQDFTLNVEYRPGRTADLSDYSTIKVSVVRVGGKNPGFDVKQMTPEIEKTAMLRKFTRNGAQTPWTFEGVGNSGYSGMMTSKAIGLYEVGFLELAFPNTPMPIGGTWSAMVLLGNESFNGDSTSDVQGTSALCTYRLVSVDADKYLAKIAFQVNTKITASYTQLPLRGVKQGKVKMEQQDSGSGEWVVDMRTGLPISFESNRTSETKFGGRVQTEKTVSAVKELPAKSVN